MIELVLPAFNEEARLPTTIRALRSTVAGGELAGTVRVIVVDNASTDRTGDVAIAENSAELPVELVSCQIRGKGAAVKAGVAGTTADIVGFMDADGATSLDALAASLRLLALGADAAIASRGLPESVTMVRTSVMRAVGAQAYRSWARRIVPGISDTQCGFKLMQGDLARRVFPQLVTRGFSFDVELLARLQREGAQIAEFGTTWVDVPGSTFSPARHGLESFAELASIRRLLRNGHRVPSASAALTPRVPLAVRAPISS
jgi:glycosyltransferase involved in cell wall biosynthesis